MSERYILMIDPNEGQGKHLGKLLADKFDVSIEWASGRDHAIVRADEIHLTLGILELVVVVLTGDGIAKGPQTDAVDYIRDNCFPKRMLVLTKADSSKLGSHTVGYIRVRPSDELAAVICSFVANVMPAERPPCLIALTDPTDLVLQHQLLTFQSQRDPTYAWLGRIIRKFVRDCEGTEVRRLTQGFSGSLVVAVRLKSYTGAIKHIVLKLAPSHDRSKLKNGVENWDEIEATLSFAGLLAHTPAPLVPEEKRDTDDGDERIVEHAGIIAIAYEFLGQELGTFCDLESAYCEHEAGGEDLCRKMLGESLDLLERVWYSHVPTGPDDLWAVPLWAPPHRAEGSRPEFPPYALSHSWKARILSSLEQLSFLGVRMGKNWYEPTKLLIKEFFNPISSTAETLTGQGRAVRSPIHGDLNRNNLIYWRDKGQVLLIDLSTYQRAGHTLQDFAHLETEVVYGLMDREVGSQLSALDYSPDQFVYWLELQDRLHIHDLFEIDDDVSRDVSSGGTGVQRASSLIRFVRGRAFAICEKRSDAPCRERLNVEYRAALLYHTLRCIGFEGLSPFKRLLAVYGVRQLLQVLDGRDAGKD